MGTTVRHQHPKPGSAVYEEHVRGEIEHYTEVFKEGEGRETLLQPVPPSWHEVERRASELIRDATGDDLNGHMVKRLNHHPAVRMLSLGSGPGGVEISLSQQASLANIVCKDINHELLDLGRQRANELGLNIEFEKADLNTIKLPRDKYDVVFCYASLHHVIELERLAEQIKRTLRPGGEIIIVDVVTRNGYIMWPETRKVVQNVWKTLPEKFRINHTSYPRPRVDEEIIDADMSEQGMECIRSEEILPMLEQNFEVQYFVPYFSIARRFLDTMYGPNYDLSAPLDLALFNWIWELDRYYLTSKKLRPETFFGIYRNLTGDRPRRRDASPYVKAETRTNTRASTLPQQPSAVSSIMAYPNPVLICDDSEFGETTLIWASVGAEGVEVRVGSPDGTLFARSGANGTKTTGKWVTNKTTFYLQNVTGGRPLTSENTLAVIEVNVATEGCL